MSRLSEILGVEERQEFKFDGTELLVKKDRLFAKNYDGSWTELCSARFLCDLIAHSEKIEIIPKKIKLTEQQITAIKGRIAEGWNWVAKDQYRISCYNYEPMQARNSFYGKESFDPKKDKKQSFANPDIFDFVTFENSPVYLPELINEND